MCLVGGMGGGSAGAVVGGGYQQANPASAPLPYPAQQMGDASPPPSTLPQRLDNLVTTVGEKLKSSRLPGFMGVVQSLGNIMASESGRAKPSLPSGLVGDQSDPRAGLNPSGKKHTSGPLKPEFGGTGDFVADLEKLTGGTRPWQSGDRAPPGSLIGENGIFGRPNSSGGQSIDIPANGNKPHETLHYP